MLFIKKHTLITEKPINIVRDEFKSSTDKINVTELNETKLHGLMKNKYGTGYDIISDINLKSISSDKTTVEIKNEFDLFTNLFLIAMFVGLWGVSIYKLINGESILSFELILMLTFPIIGALITKSSFGIYDKRIMKIYSSLLNNKEPN
ncbi:hypothetical protein H9I45_01320 [Polaribacter haliotis]|uniref:Uncharacterized protein n=1 Tax=Polaribacter haliotis TaxID=1888915 RepID=A0A7L8AGL7_9FLAO|nr:hypothetical protein [Polaribacter haliotis]QOD61110.1 hypothetical protein H9I45_01320 [Polaribacter haliotis]